MASKNRGFTIVELLIVIVVIAILAAITIVAYNGIQNRARVSTLSSALTQAAKKISVWQVDNPNQYPPSLSDAGINDTTNVSFQYTVDNTSSSPSYCVTGTYGSTSYRVSNANTRPESGVCSGFNLLVWNEPDSATQPVNSGPGVAIDTSVYRTPSASIRISPNSTGKNVRGSTYDVSPGETYTVRLWIQTDSNWNGTGNNSKIRFGNVTAGSLATACGYNGVKSTWVEVSCSYTIPASGMSQMSVSVGNDGTVGNIWIDDLSFSRS